VNACFCVCDAEADSVEIKLIVPIEERSRSTVALGVGRLDAQNRQVFFFDTPDLTLAF
jgi:hypothetical protein